MAQQGNYFDQFDSAPAGPVLGPPPKPEKPEKPPEPKTTWRTLSPAEAKAQGLPENGTYQVSSQGEVKVVKTPAEKTDPSTPAGRRDIALSVLGAAGIDLTKGQDPVAELIKGSTSGGLQKAGADAYAFVTGDATDGMEKIGRLQVIGNDLVLKAAGGSLGAQISNSDREFIAARMGDIANPDIPVAQRLAAWEQVKQRLGYDAGIEVGPPAGGSKRRWVDDAETNKTLFAMFREGRSWDEMQAYAGSRGYRLEPNPKAFEYARKNPGYNPFGSAGRYDEGGETEGADASAANRVDGNDPGYMQFAAGVGDLVEGGLNYTVGLVANPLNTAIFRGLGYDNYTSDIGQTARDALGLPEGDPTISMINQGAAGGLAFGGGAALGAARALPGVARNALLQVGASPVGDAIVGGAAAGSGEAVRAAGGNEAMQAGASLLGGLASAGAVSRFGRQPRPMPPGGTPPTDPRTVIQAGQREGVKVMTSDVRPPTSAAGRTAQLVGENIPIAGTGDVLGGRATQQGQRVAATERIVAELGGNPASVDDVTRDFVATRKGQLTKLVGAKDSVIDAVQTPVTAPKAVAEIDRQIARLNSANKEAFAPFVAKLENFKQVLSSGKSLREVEINRGLLGDLFDDTGLAGIKGEGQKALNAIYNPLRSDMGDAIQASLGSGAKAKWQKANDKLADMATELGDSKFRNVLNRADSDPEEVAKLLFSKRPGDIRRLFGNLSETGKNKARSAIIYEAAQKATDGDAINPDRFKTAIKAMDSATGIFFSPADKARIDGFVRLLQATGRAQQVGANLNTGARNSGLIANFGIAGLFGAKGAAAASAYGVLARIYESGPARDLILKLGKTKPGSPAEAAVGKRLSDYLTRAGILQNPANDMGEAVNRSTTAAYAEDQEQK